MSRDAAAGALTCPISFCATERREHRLTLVGGAHGADQFVAGCVLQQIAGGTGLDRGQHVRVAVEGGEHQDPDRRGAPPQQPDRLDAAHPRHPQIHQHHVHAERDRPVHRQRAVPGLPRDGEVRVALEDSAQAVAYDGVVVGDEQRDGHASFSTTRATPVSGATGTCALIAVPSPGALSTASAPPTSRSLRRMAVSP
jgi:hypothetical protein